MKWITFLVSVNILWTHVGLDWHKDFIWTGKLSVTIPNSMGCSLKMIEKSILLRIKIKKKKKTPIILHFESGFTEHS